MSTLEKLRATDAGHPIAVVSARTGLSRDVLRVWERRYHVVEPMRTLGGQRLYSDEQVQRFRLLAAVTRHGRSISIVAKLADDELARLASEDEASLSQVEAEASPSVECTVDAALDAVRLLDGTLLDAQLRRAIARNGVPWFLEQLVPALMRQVGDRWASGQLSIAHEHLASAAVLAIILETVRAVPSAASAPRVVVATPSGERHAMGAALAAAAATLAGWAVVYLGADMPAADISSAAAATAARAVALSIVYVDDSARTVAELTAVRDALRADVPMLIGGASAAAMVASLGGRGVTLCENVAALRAAFAREAFVPWPPRAPN